MVCRAYGYCRVSKHEVRQRLHMGDGQPNRVHLAVRGGTLVGCCSSTLQTPWCPSGCGHWGLLAVDPAAQGQGVASALVAAAEALLYGAGLREVQIEYDYQRGEPQSERLYAWYEGTCGFSGPLSRSSGFRRCRKRLRPPTPSRASKPAEAAERTPLVGDAAAAAPGGETRAAKRRRPSGPSTLAGSPLSGCSAGLMARLRKVLTGCGPKRGHAAR